MREPSFADAFEVLCLQAADQGRGPLLFGDSLSCARAVARPFMVGKEFPSVYLEFPLIGEPFLDVTVLYGALEPGTRIESEAAAGAQGVVDWFASVSEECDGISFGFELDTKEGELPAAAIHFQPRRQTELVRPFCEAIDEPERADLYLGLSERLPKRWPLSFFGMFRGRSNSPLRVCGYLDRQEVGICGRNPGRLSKVFDSIGFEAYDRTMLAQASELLAASKVGTDFQFDIHSDGRLGDMFALDIQFGIEQPHAVRTSFETGIAGTILGLLEQWGIADERWKLAPEAAFARSIPAERDDGSLGLYAFTLMPQWVKARWKGGVLQQAKLYYVAKAGFTSGKRNASGHSGM